MTMDKNHVRQFATMGLLVCFTPAVAQASAGTEPTTKLQLMQSAIRDGALKFAPHDYSAKSIDNSHAIKLAGDCPAGYGRMYNDGKCHKGFAQ